MTDDESRKEQAADVEFHHVGHRDGVAGNLQHRFCVHQVSVANPHALLAPWISSRFQQLPRQGDW